ncbi:MAG: AAA family ATPase, partial [Candidatus Buchananbacteria bacterium]
MSDLEPKKAPFKILVCAHCQGNGRLKRKTCPQCKGLGVAAWTGKDLLYWGKKINNLQIAQEQLGQTVKNIITLSLFLFGAIGFVMLGLVVIAFVQAQLPFYAILEIKNWQLLVFWVSLLTDCYLFYHLQREIENTRYIPKRKFKDSLENNLAISWQEIKQLPKNHKINVTNYFTGQATQAIVKAWQTAGKYEDEKTNPIHLFISLLSLEQTHVIFSRLGVAFPTLKAKVGRVLSLQPSKTDSPLILSEKLKEIIFQSYILAYQTKQKKVEITELLEALVSQENEVKELLYDLKITVDKIQNVIAWLRMKKQLRSNWKNFRKQAALKPSTTMNRSMTAIATPILDSFSQDMTILAQGGYLLPCVGRQKEFDKLFNILSGGPRRSVLLTGFPGVGKNTIIEGLAQKMVEEEVPDFLQDKRLVSLSIAKLISGATPVLAQERLMLIINEIRRSGNIILYIGDIHNMIGITAGRQGSIDLADVLSQALANNTILCLAATTPGDYHRYIEAKSSLDNVFEQLEVQEVSGNEAILVLESKIGIIESHNEVFFSYDAIEKTVELSDRYLHDRYLPEKAIGILQEVATKVKEKKGKGGIVAAEDIAMVISSKTNIPLTEITKEESQKLLNLEEKIHQRMVDQQEAVLMVAASLRRARAEMRDKSRPIVNLL